jgi:Ca-activated chloride channel family protein
MRRFLASSVLPPGRLGRRLPGVIVVITAISAAVGVAQDAGARFSTRVQAVEVYATVTDAAGEPVTGLLASDFAIEDEGEAQTISTFAEGSFPLTVALGVDRSLSMAGEPLRLARRAAQSFLEQLQPGDRSMVVAINSAADIIAPLGTARDEQREAVAGLDAWSTTALRDALVTTLDRLEPEAGRQALVVFSDGVDRYSRTDAASMVARASRSQALVYPIVLGRGSAPALAEVAAQTGGRAFVIRDARTLEPTLGRIARELRHQYLLGYVPAAPGGSRWHPIRVRVAAAASGRWSVRARSGYLAQER